jgi:hypothetical protein
MKTFVQNASTEITEAEYNYSLNRFERPLCREHRDFRKLENGVSRTPVQIMKMMSIEGPFLKNKASH